MRYKTRGRYKSSELLSVLIENLGSTMNLARIKCLSALVCAMCKVQTVNFSKLAAAFDNTAEKDSSMRRIQRFMSQAVIDMDWIAKLVIKLLPFNGPYILSMDRTNWKFGQVNINALVVGITYKSVAFPVLFTLLDKRGNSNCEERIAIMQRFIRLFGRDCIDCLVADREFVGERWIEWLNEWSIPYHLRIKENFWVEDPRSGKEVRAKSMFIHLKDKQELVLHRIYRIKGQLCYLSGARLKNSEGVPELQILVSFNHPEKAIDSYKERWQIETMFRGMKSSGFNIEDTHLIHLERIEQLFGVMVVAFTWAYLVGIKKDLEVKAIRILKTGNRAISIVKYGLEHIASALLNPLRPQPFDIFKILSCA